MDLFVSGDIKPLYPHIQLLPNERTRKVLTYRYTLFLRLVRYQESVDEGNLVRLWRLRKKPTAVLSPSKNDISDSSS